MGIEVIKKRSGEVVPFDADKIKVAILKSYEDEQDGVDGDKLDALVVRVIDTLRDMFVEEAPDVETVQDVVERAIADVGDFEVSRSYIVYRSKQAEKRKQEEMQVVKKVTTRELIVTKRDGSKVVFDPAQIENAIRNSCLGFEADVDIEDVITSCIRNLYDGIPTSEINKAIVMALKARIERDTAYSYITARFLFNDLYKEVFNKDEFEDGFLEAHKENFEVSMKHGVEEGRIHPDLLSYDFEKVSSALKPERDNLFEYMGAQVLHDRYFMRDTNMKLFETPQYFWMRVAMGLALKEEDKEEKAIEFYDTLSQLFYVPSTPTLLHSGTNHPQMSSCYLNYVEDDLTHIFKVIGDNAQMSKWSGGIGGSWTPVIATNARIKSTNVPSQGLIPFLKIVDATTASINRSGKRRGANCVYLETWHADIEDFLDLRKNTGDDRRRTHDLNTAHWIPDLFMKRVAEDGQWTLFSPEEVPDLHEIYGAAFEKRYEEYEAMAERGEITLFKKVSATKLWRKMITMIFETGHPWMTWKDACNIRSPQDHVGVIHSSNLCTEITLNTSKDETAVCNLGSVNLLRHFENGKINKEQIAETVAIAMRMLDNVIDINFYPTIEAENSNMRHRPVGLGVMGFQDVLYMKGLPFDCDEAVQLSDEYLETISYYAILNSSKLAKEKGAYSSYEGSKWSRGIFPVDTIELLEQDRGIKTGISKTGAMDWSEVRDHVKEYGMRNSNTLAIAPTATIANISGVLPSIEPIYKNLYVKSNFSGEFTVLNKYLVRDLKKKNLWSEGVLEQLKHYDGSVQLIDEVSEDMKTLYKEVFEIDASWIVKHAAHRQKWMDQSQSVNLFTSSSSGKFVGELYMNAWKSGLKTTYYLRTLGASAIEKSTIDINKKFADTPKEEVVVEETPAKKGKLHVFTEDTCESCQ
ncbi:MAG: ribonucleoside-diphosphate reductase alpha chain [Flavobacteriaceae bacterium]|jgi:ribonucleoside-diphosphate reductase alpha chain